MATASAHTRPSSAEPDLGQLLARIARQDQVALAHFYDRTSSRVYGFVCRMLNHPAVAEEVTLDVYAQVWVQAGHYDSARSAPLTWLIMMARCRAIDSLRSRNNGHHFEPLGSAAPVADISPNAEEALAARESQEIIRAALQSLQPLQREAIELAFYSGLSHSEIAAKLTEPVGTVKSRIRLGMKHLREHLQQLRDRL